MDLLLNVAIEADLSTLRLRWFAAGCRAPSRCVDNGGRLWLYGTSV
jgi:hypothetical protein